MDKNLEDRHEAEVIYAPKEAARLLGIVPSSLRRLAPVYEAVYGPLPTQPTQEPDIKGGRLWPPQAVERLRAGRALVAEGRVKSLDHALRALQEGSTPPPELSARQDSAEMLLEAVGRLQAQLDEIPRLREEVSQLRAELRDRDRALPPSASVSRNPSRPMPFWAEGKPETAPEASSEPRAGSTDATDGVIVRLARRLERILGRR